MFVTRGVFFNSDDNGNGGGSGDGGGTGGTGGSGGEGGANGNPSDNGGQGNGTPPQNPGTGQGEGGKPAKVEFSADQQAEVNRLLAAERKATEKRQREAAEAERLKEQGKHKELHEALEKRVKEELEPKAALADELAAEVNSLLDAEIAGWAASLKEQDPGKDDVKARMAWVKRSRKLAEDLKTVKTAPNGEHGQGSDAQPTSAAAVSGLLAGRYAVPGAKKA